MKSTTKTFGELLPNPSCAPGHFVGHFTAKRASEDILRTGGEFHQRQLLWLLPCPTSCTIASGSSGKSLRFPFGSSPWM